MLDGTRPKALRILAVQSEGTDSDEMIVALSAHGALVQCAGTAPQALDQYLAFEPDVVLVCAGLHSPREAAEAGWPRQAAIQLCRRVAALPGSDTTVLVLTGKGLDGDLIQRAFASGADDILECPCSPRVLCYRFEHLVESKRVASRLRASRARLVRAQQVAQLGHWEWSADSQVLRCSAQVRRLLALPEPQTHSQQIAVFCRYVYPQDVQYVMGTIAEALNAGATYSVEYRLVSRNGQVRTVQEKARADRGANGQVIALVGTLQDITDRRETPDRSPNLASVDEATQLPNRAGVDAEALMQHADAVLCQAKSEGSTTA